MRICFNTFITVLLLLASTACRDNLCPQTAKPPTPGIDEKGDVLKEDTTVRLSLSHELFDFEENEQSDTKSGYLTSARTRVNEAVYYLFHNGLLVSHGYTTETDDFGVTIPAGYSTTTKFTLMLLGNVGDCNDYFHVKDGTTRVEDMKSLCVNYTDLIRRYDSGKKSLFEYIDAHGFPGSRVYEDFTSAGLDSYKLQRLTHTLRLQMNTSALSGSTSIKFTKVSICNGAKEVIPFAEKSTATEIESVMTDETCSQDITDLNNGKEVVLYTLENCHGNILTEADTWKERTPSAVLDAKGFERGTREGEAFLRTLTYFEVEADVTTPLAEMKGNKYRTYLGTGPGNFDVPRNTCFTITNNFTKDFIPDEEWRVENDPNPTVKGELKFVDTRYDASTAPRPLATGDVPDKPYSELGQSYVMYVMPDFIHSCYIYRSDPSMEYTISIDSDYEISYTTEKIDEHFTKISIIGNHWDYDEDGSFLEDTFFPYSILPIVDVGESKEATITVRANDRPLEATLRCRCVDKPLELRIASFPNNYNESNYAHEYLNHFGYGSLNDLFLMYNNMFGLKINTPRFNITVDGFLVGDPSQPTSPSSSIHSFQRVTYEYEHNSFVINKANSYNRLTTGKMRSRIYTDYSSEYSFCTLEERVNCPYGYALYELWQITVYQPSSSYQDFGYDRNLNYRHAYPEKISFELKGDFSFSSPNTDRIRPVNDYICLPVKITLSNNPLYNFLAKWNGKDRGSGSAGIGDQSTTYREGENFHNTSNPGYYGQQKLRYKP